MINGHGEGLLVDTGCDPRIVTELERIEANNNFQPVSKVILTHSHYDHAKMLGEIKKRWSVESYAYSSYLEGIDLVVRNGDQVRMGGYSFDILHVPGHTTDSLCVFSREEGILFSGDTPLVIWGTDATYELAFVHAFEELVNLDISTIYPGHGEPITANCNQTLKNSFRNLRKSRLI
jgi:glyoxylase-like metal-dependent hydrolase (beta-lactamase superfamily II)